MLAEILLPAGTQTVPVVDIPGLLARALHPDVPEGRMLSHVDKMSSETATPEGLDGDDEKALKRIWEGLSNPTGLSESDWPQYVQAFVNAQAKPDWHLAPVWRDPSADSRFRRHQAEIQHRQFLMEAIRRGQLVTHDSIAFLPAAGKDYGAQLDAYVMVNDLVQYAAKLNIGVRVATAMQTSKPGTSDRLTVFIDGREALPVRAIPYITGWQTLTPDDLAQNLARSVEEGMEKLPNLFAYHLVGGSPQKVWPKEWDAVVVRIAAFEAELREKYPNRARDYAAWRDQAASKLPAGVFTWLDEFEREYRACRKSWSFIPERAGDDQLILAPMPDAATRAMVMEGFDAIAAEAAEFEQAGTSEHADSRATLSNEKQEIFRHKAQTEIPGKLPRTSMGKVVIEAAWEIESETGRPALVTQVLKRLWDWASKGMHAEVLIAPESSEKKLKWRTIKGASIEYKNSTCQKALETWMKSRRTDRK
jgi:hypothetical protein